MTALVRNNPKAGHDETRAKCIQRPEGEAYRRVEVRTGKTDLLRGSETIGKVRCLVDDGDEDEVPDTVNSVLSTERHVRKCNIHLHVGSRVNRRPLVAVSPVRAPRSDERPWKYQAQKTYGMTESNSLTLKSGIINGVCSTSMRPLAATVVFIVPQAPRE